MDKSDFVAILEKIPDLNTQGAIRMIGGSAAIYEKVFRKIIKLIPSHSEKMRKSLFEDKDLRSFSVEIHGVKSSLAQLGNRRLAETAEMLEKAAKSGNADLCGEYFDSFDNELMAFWGTACHAINSVDGGAEADSASFGGSVEDFCSVIKEAMEEAEEFECQKVSELLTPIFACSFGPVTDELLKETANSLDLFRPNKVAECLAAILDEYKNKPEWH